MLLIVTMSLSSCSLSFDSQDLMVPPRPTGDEAAILKEVERQAGKDYTLINPVSGNNRSAVITSDLDDDNDKEGVALYKTNDEMHIMFLNYQNGSYKPLADIISPSSFIDRVDFADIDGDTSREILIGTNNNAQLNYLYAYKLTDTVEEIQSEISYSTYITGDMTGNMCDDIVIFTVGGDITNSASLIKYSDGILINAASCQIENSIYKIENMVYGLISPSITGITFDGSDSSTQFMSEVIYFDKDSSQLIDPLYSSTSFENTKRYIQIESQDVDGDGITDIPLCSLMPGNENEDPNTLCTKVSFSDYDIGNEHFLGIRDVIYNQNDKYMFTMPISWIDSVTARYDSVSRELTVYVWDYGYSYDYEYDYSSVEQSLDKPLLTIKTFPKDSYEQNKSGYFEITRNASYVFAYTVYDTDSDLIITGDDVINNFTNI